MPFRYDIVRQWQVYFQLFKHCFMYLHAIRKPEGRGHFCSFGSNPSSARKCRVSFRYIKCKTYCGAS